MTSKYITFGAAGLLFGAIAFFWGVNPQTDCVSNYTPRTIVEEVDRDAAGAAEITRMLLGDIETGEINSQGLSELRAKVLKKAAAQSRLNLKNTDLAWAEMGPDNIGGRTRALALVNESLLYAGAVSGGLWRSLDGANTWNHVTSFPSLMVGSIAVANNGDIYVGTGSLFEGGSGNGDSGFRGRGIWWSNDGGETFSIVEGTDPGEFSSGDFSATDALVKHPLVDDLVWYGSNSSFGSIQNGVISIDPSSGGPTGGVSDIAVAPDASYMLVAASNARVYRSTNNTLLEFELITSGSSSPGNLPQSGIGRCRIAISQDDPNHAFALYATTGGLFYGLYYSSEASQEGTWSVCWPGGEDAYTPLSRGQGIYDLALGIKKGQPDLAFVGGISLWKSGPNQQAEMAAAPFNYPGFPYGVHADIQDIVITEAGTMYVTTDGGIYKSDDGGDSYTACNHNYNVTQFYAIAHSAGEAVLGGTQDNGSLFIPGDGYFLSDQNAVSVVGGDGFDCAISQVTESIEHTYAWFAASQNGGLARGTISPGENINLGGFYDDEIIELIDEEGDLGGFYTCLRLYEDTEDENSQRNVIVVNPYGETVTDSTFTLYTSNQNLPFDWTIPAGDELMFYENIIRPELLLDAPLTTDPNYFWLTPQINEEQIVCVDDTVSIDTVDVISEIIPNLLDTTMIVDGVEYDVQIDLGNDTIFVEEVQYSVVDACDTMYYHFPDTIFGEPERRKIQDPYTTMLTLGLTGSEGIWMTRDALNFNTTPNWIRLGNAPGGAGAKVIEYVVNDEAAGDVMFVSGWNGSLYRFSGLSEIYIDSDVDDHIVVDQLITNGSVITGVSIDPNNANHMVITLGGYGSTSMGKVRETWNALAPSPSFSNIWSGGLNNMPMYDVVIDSQDASGSTIIVGTEYGIFVTDNGGSEWTIANLGMAATAEELTAPVFDLKQQWRSNTNWSSPTNTGAIYAGTHGRGIFRSDTFLGADDLVIEENSVESLLVYPNPASYGSVQVSTRGFAGEIKLEVYDLQGRIVYSDRIENTQSSERALIDISGLSNGTYVVRMVSSQKQLATKLVIRR